MSGMKKTNMKCVASTDDIGRYLETHFYNKQDAAKKIEETVKYNLRVVTGRANRELAMDICKILGTELGDVRINQSASHEMAINFNETGVNGDDVYVVQPMCIGDECTDLNTAVMEFLFMVHALKLNGAQRVTGIIPYVAYSRQDCKNKPRVPISASAVCQLIQSMGIDRVLTVDLHCGQIQGFFHNTPVDNLPTHHEFSRYTLKTIVPKEGVTNTREELTIVAPDANGVERARLLANLTDARGVVSILKRTLSTGQLKLEMVGDVKDQVCVIIDDLIDTGHTMLNAVRIAAERGAKAIYGVATHGILTDPAIDLINNCKELTQVIITDSVNVQNKQSLCPKLHVITIAPMIAAAIERTHREVSLNALFS
eukprot:TRINITY_DN37986_c0_g1_i1.p1 TRINITY_DN37986_c0_g1~~TRINITY_DN37986_c0_g1_i1.p1  ORF type:complete len:370 (+),score=99.90 TRINITY_DN37986_c0_g1_i1:63-1172(+)